MTQELAEVYAGRMNGILTIPRLFKYAKCDIAIKILENETLKWSTPDSFNDPFEFKSPFEYGFDWDEMKEIALRGMATILTQLEEPHLFFRKSSRFGDSSKTLGMQRPRSGRSLQPATRGVWAFGGKMEGTISGR
jgi:hypothetical protein